MCTLKPQHIQLLPSEKDGKRWVAEITGDDETFILKRDFQPEKMNGIWEIYDGWYQIHGQVPGVTPFQKEYVRVQAGQMTRQLDFRYVRQHLNDIKAAEPQRMERIKHQINSILDDIKEKAPYEQVEEAIELQKESLDSAETSEQLLNGLKMLIKRKDNIIKEYNDVLSKNNITYDW